MAVKFLNGIDVDGSMNIAASDVPNLDASKITSGTLSADRIPNLSGTYQPAGDYLTLETAETSFQPIGNYLTSVPAEYLTQTEGDARYLQTYDGLQSSHVTGALGYTPYQEGTDLSAYTVIFANIEKSNVNLDGEMGWDANDTEAPATLGSYGGSYPDGLYLRGSGTLYTVYHTGHFSGTHISNWNTAYGWGNHASAGYLKSLPSHNHDTLYDAIGSADAVNVRIDEEVFPAIPTNNNQLTNGAGYITAVPSSFSANSITIGGGATLTESTDRSDLLMIKSSTSSWGGLQVSNTSNEGIISLMINGNEGGLYDDQNGEWILKSTENGGLTLGYDNVTKLTTTSAGITITGEIVTTGGNSTNWNTAYGWGNHASAGYLTSIPSSYATDAEVSSAVGAIESSINERIDTEVFDAIATVDGNIPTNNNQLTNGAGYITSFDITTQTDGKYLRSNADDSFSGNLTSAQSKWIKFYHPTQTDSNDGKIGAGVFDTGLNIVGVQTVAGTGRQVRVWGDLITSTGTKYATESYVNTAVSNLVDAAPGALNTLNELAAALGDDANFSTTVTNNIAAVDTRINEEVLPYVDSVAADASKGVTAYGWGNHASAGYLTSLPNNAATFTNNIYLSNSATTANFITELTNLGAFQDNYKAFKVAWSYAGNSNLDVGFESVELAGCLIECWGGTYKHVRLTRPTTGTGGRSIYVYNDQGSSYSPGWRQIWTSDEFNSTSVSNWNTAYGWGNHASAGYLTSIPSSYATDAEVSSAVGAIETSINERIETEVLPAIDSKLDSTAKAADSNLLDGINSSQFLRSDANDTKTGDTTFTGKVTLQTNLVITEDAPTISFLDTTSGADDFYIHVNSNNFYVLRDTAGSNTVDGGWDSPHPMQLEGDTNRVYFFGNRVLSAAYQESSAFATSAQGTKADTAHGWGNHASAGYLKSIPSTYVQQTQDIVSGNIHPVGDREQLLGLESNRWQVVFCEILDSAGQHEKNLQNPEGEKSVGEYETGTVLVWKDGKNIPCTEAADHMRMGIAVQGVASPLIQGAEPVLVTGTVNEGDYLVTSSVEGHAKAISPQFMRQHGLYDCVLGKALESGEGESYLLKTWINI